jgi:hypothetical protein
VPDELDVPDVSLPDKRDVVCADALIAAARAAMLAARAMRCVSPVMSRSDRSTPLERAAQA